MGLYTAKYTQQTLMLGVIKSLSRILCHNQKHHSGICLMMFNFSEIKQSNPAQMIVLEEQIKRIKEILGNPENIVNAEGQAFFCEEQAQLSLKILQIERIDQLRHHIVTYEKRDIVSEDRDKEALLRCKFIILHKYCILGGKYQDQAVRKLLGDVWQHANLLQQDFLVRLLRMHLEAALPPGIVGQLPKINSKSNENSQLVHLLLLIYPEQKQEICQYYVLRRQKLTEVISKEEQSLVPILYSPLHLMHIQRTCPFLPEIEALIDLSMQTADTESDNVHLESLFHDQQELLEHQNRALSYALEHGMQEICEKYLFSVKDYFNNVSYPRVLRLLNSAMISPFKPNQQIMQFISCGLARLASKMASTNQSSEAALEENTLYVQLAHLQNSLLIKSREWPLQMQPALQSMFDNNLSWRVDTKQLSLDDILTIIVCLVSYKIKIEQSQLTGYAKQFFIELLDNYRLEIDEMNPQQLKAVNKLNLFYVALFAHKFNCDKFILSPRTILLFETTNNELSESAREQCARLIKSFREQQARLS